MPLDHLELQAEINRLKSINAEQRTKISDIEADLVTVVGTLGNFAGQLGIDFSQFKEGDDIASVLPSLIFNLMPKLTSGGLDLGEIKEIIPMITKYKYLLEETNLDHA
ncbi:hypothetical protein [Lishizhenia sp.]|uniref:hypothetical protein n=1 Tax=Lishizhenia sp. TaxID=2497594 RepID=UPI00299E594E|nr:hypothetical protein [Lishizhenia sp.]MDX1447220.1 hypothetical protein [Lishizhenia sp.]